MLRRADKILARAGKIPQGLWVCLQHRNDIHRKKQTMFRVLHHGGTVVHWQKDLSLNGFTKLEKIYQITDLGQTGAVNANSRPTKA